MNFSERLKELRLEAGITQQELAVLLGVTEGAIRKYESNRGKPRANNLERLANVFEVSVSYLLGETNIPDSSSIMQILEMLSEDEQQEVILFAQELLENKKSTNS